MNVILRIMRIALRHRWQLAGAYVCTAGATAAYVYLPKLFGETIDRLHDAFKAGGIGHIPESTILTIVLTILAVSVVRGVLGLGQTYLGESLSQSVSYDLRNAFYDHVQHLSFAFHDRHHTGNLMSRAITDVEGVRMFVNMGLIRTPYFVSLFIIVAVTLLRLDWRLGLMATSFMPFVVFQSAVVRLKMRRIWIRVLSANPLKNLFWSS